MKKVAQIGGLIVALMGVSRGLEVHEWGTFTVLSSPEGGAMNWYQPGEDLAKLPPFVASPFLMMKRNLMASLRMETPVLYFYPEEEMDVAVQATLLRGQITEAYPHSRSQMGKGEWQVRLFPPDHVELVEQIPVIENSDPLEPYEAAREVPDAWIVRQDSLTQVEGETSPPQCEKFIFYRGSGQVSVGLQVGLSPEGQLVRRNYDDVAYPFSVALHVDGGRAAWSRLASMPSRGEEGGALVESDLPRDWQSLSEVEEQLVAAFTERLKEEGLSRAEAAAMVKTWRATWFREPGVRVFSTVPREKVDKILPLTISPQPEELERVFVLRSEVVEPTKLSALDRLLQTTTQLGAEQQEQFRQLELGRFRMGYFQAWQQREALRVSQRFSKLSLE